MNDALCEAACRQWAQALHDAHGMLCMFAHPLIPSGVCYLMNMDFINGTSETRMNDFEMKFYRPSGVA